jgi:hypothetical protein
VHTDAANSACSGSLTVGHEINPEIQLRRGAHRLRDALDGARHPLADHLHRRVAERANRAREARGLRDDVVGVAGVELRDRQHGGIHRRDVARDDGLQGGRDLRADHDRIDARLRPGAMRADAGDVDVEERPAGHHRPRAHREAPDRELRPVVHAEDRVARESLEQPVVDHRLRAAEPLLGRLEHEVDGAVEVARGGQHLGSAQQHRGVTIVAARMHASGVAGAMLEGVGLLDRQRVHVGAQADRAGRTAVAQHADHPGAADAAMHLDAEGLEALRDQPGRAALGEAELRMGVDVAAPGGELGVVGFDQGRQPGHIVSSSGGAPQARAPDRS